MTTSRIAVLLLTCTLAGAGAVVAAPPASAASGWTAVQGDYGRTAQTPSFAWCEVSETGSKVTLRIRATRSSAAVVSHSTYWNKRSDFTGASGTADGSTWTGNRSVVKLTLPRSSYLRISWQTAQSGYAFTELRRTPLGLARCA
jgi:hypothetical protein